MLQQTFQTSSAQQTQALVPKLMDSVQSNVLALVGDLGSGKTTFTQAIGEYFDIQTPVTSPTFLIMKSYSITNHTRYKKLIHLDLYRISSWEEVAELGITEWWNDPTSLIVIEWAERIMDHLPENTTVVTFEYKSKDSREITVSTRQF